MNKRILYLIQQTGMLMNMPRTHIKNLGNSYDTVSSHSHHTAVISYCITRMEGLSHEDGLLAIAMATFHDVPEARTGDFDFVAKFYNQKDEDRAVEDSYKGVSFGKDLLKIIREYEKRETSVSKCVKDADLVEQMYQEWYLSWQGNKLAKNWFDRNQRLLVPKLYTKSARLLAKSMKYSNPHEWWFSEFIDN